jgi:Rrf2 family transcriptional regulator, iron-sulfur cluster assembly transcription factor
MLLSKSCMYGLRAGVLLASKKSNGFVTIKELSDELDISFFFLTKVLQQMTKAGLLESYKGPNGGVKLARESTLISFMDVVEAIDGTAAFEDCALGLPGCGILKPCPMHDQWSVMKQEISTMLKDATLEKLAERNKAVTNPGTAIEHLKCKDFFKH